jgi:hypothetical protein
MLADAHAPLPRQAGRRSQPSRVAVDEREVTATPGQRQRDRPADAAGRTRHHGDAAAQRERRRRHSL